MALCAGHRRPGPKRLPRPAVVVLALAVALIAALGCASTGHNPPPVAGGTVVLTAINMPRDMAADISADMSAGVSVAGAGVYQHAGRVDDDAGCAAARTPCARVCPADAAVVWDTPTTGAPPPSTALTYPVWAMREGPAPSPRPAATAPGGRALTEQLGVIRR